MRSFLVALAWLALSAQAAEPALRPSARLLFKDPDMLKAGQCVRYEEGGTGFIMTEPVFYLRGEVLASAVETRHLGHCPLVPGKNLDQYTRAEFIRHARAYPCVSMDVAERDEQMGIVRVRVLDWETPYAKRAENAGRLYRGHFIDQPLRQGTEIEMEADLLEVCRH